MVALRTARCHLQTDRLALPLADDATTRAAAVESRRRPPLAAPIDDAMKRRIPSWLTRLVLRGFGLSRVRVLWEQGGVSGLLSHTHGSGLWRPVGSGDIRTFIFSANAR